MSIPLVVNGATFNYPVNFDENWGIDATGWAQAVTNGMLQRSGGNFPLTADANFGASFGLIASYFTSRAPNPATSGTLRLASADLGIAFRNNANSGNLILTTNASDNLLYNGQILTTSSSSPTFTSLTLTNPLTVANGGTGDNSLAAYAVLTGGTTSTNPVQSVSIGSVGQVLTSNGPGMLPTFANTTGSGTVNSGTINRLAYYPANGTVISSQNDLSYGSDILTVQGSTHNAQLSLIGAGLGSSTATILMQGNGFTNKIISDNVGNLLIQDFDNSRAILTYTRATPGLSTSLPLAMGSNKITGLAAPTATGDALSQGNAVSATTISGTTGTFSGQILAENGAAGAPSYSFSSDTATGWDLPNSHEMAAYSNGQLAIDIKTDSSVMIRGTTTNNSPTPGFVGEWIKSTLIRTSAVSLTNAVFVDITTIALTAGDWDVTGIGGQEANGSTPSGFQVAVSEFSGNTMTDHIMGDNVVASPAAGNAVEDGTLVISAWRVSLSSPATIYLKMRIDSGGGPPLGYGRISARRMR